MSDPKVPVKNEPHDAKHDHKQPENAGITNAAIAKLIADAVSEALKVAIPAAAIGINAANQASNDRTKQAVVREVMRRTERCPICLLPKTACGGPFRRDKDGVDIAEKHEDGSPKYDAHLNHELAYVGPKDDNLFRWFQGVTVNGIRFLSNRPGHRIWIPKKSDILTNINAWEQNEKDLSQKRTAEGNGAGSVSASGQVLNRGNSNAIGWR